MCIVLWGNIQQASEGGRGGLVRTTILNKVSGKAPFKGDIWTKTEAGEGGSLKIKWKSGAAGACLGA